MLNVDELGLLCSSRFIQEVDAPGATPRGDDDDADDDESADDGLTAEMVADAKKVMDQVSPRVPVVHGVSTPLPGHEKICEVTKSRSKFAKSQCHARNLRSQSHARNLPGHKVTPEICQVTSVTLSSLLLLCDFADFGRDFVTSQLCFVTL